MFDNGTTQRRRLPGLVVGASKIGAEARGNIGPEAKTAVPPLLDALTDEPSDVRQAAAEALKKIRGEE